MINILVLSCLWVNNMLFCAEGKSKQLIFPVESFESGESLQYRFAKDLKDETLVKMIYNGKNSIDGELMNGCKLRIKDMDTQFFVSLQQH